MDYDAVAEKRIREGEAYWQHKQDLTIARVYGLFLSLKNASEYELVFFSHGVGRLQHILSGREVPWQSLEEAESVLHGMVSEQYGKE